MFSRLYKSPKTKPLGEGKCNVPICMDEELRAEIDAVVANLNRATEMKMSRNTYLLEAVLEHLRRTAAIAALLLGIFCVLICPQQLRRERRVSQTARPTTAARRFNNLVPAVAA